MMDCYSLLFLFLLFGLDGRRQIVHIVVIIIVRNHSFGRTRDFVASLWIGFGGRSRRGDGGKLAFELHGCFLFVVAVNIHGGVCLGCACLGGRRFGGQ